MQADWEIEIGRGAPVIDAAWSGLVDLRRNPERVDEVGETALVPALAPALLRLNSAWSSVWTVKCDVWTPEAIDPDELDAPAAETACALACYIDLLPRAAADRSSLVEMEAFCRRLCGLLRLIPARCCRADLIVRRAVLGGEGESLGITAYLSACGASQDGAATALSAAISASADSLCPNPAQEKTA
ncbi:MAG: hypothetical protein WBX09_06405 [Terracidiphilus sp.]